MRAFSIILLFSLTVLVSCQSSESSDAISFSSTVVTNTTVVTNMSSTSFSDSSSSSAGISKTSESSGDTNKIDATTSVPLNLDNKEKLVNYTTKQKTVFIACCGGTCVILIALAVLSGMSDTVARSRQKASRTHS